VSSAPAADRAALVARIEFFGKDRIPPLFTLAAEMLDTGDAADRAAALQLVDDLLTLQETDESSRAAGGFPQLLDGEPGDLNYTMFPVPPMVALARRHGAGLPAGLAARLEEAIRLGVLGTERRWAEETFDLHRSGNAYTNAFLAYVRALLVAGLYLEDARLQRTARAQWAKWFHEVSYYGIGEFVSDYYAADHEILKAIAQAAPDAQMAREVALAREHLDAVSRAVWHPRLQLPVSGMSRIKRTTLAQRTARAGVKFNFSPARFLGLPEAPPDDRTYPYAVEGRATRVPFFFRSWQLPRAGLGTMSGGHYFRQQLLCMAAAGESPERRDVLFLPFNFLSLGGFSAQAGGRALCLFTRRPHSTLRINARLSDEAIAAHTRRQVASVALTDGWSVAEEAAGRLVARAWGHAVTVDLFRLEGEAVRPVVPAAQPCRTLKPPSQPVTEYLFPEGDEWFGCLVQLAEGEAAGPPPGLQVQRERDRLRLEEGDDLRLDLHLFAHGEVLELHDRAWQTLPLLATPEQRLEPGELTVRALNETERSAPRV
jgi:hypothetical protein